MNAYSGVALWAFGDCLVQIQAKRWIHTVGRKEVAELRGSLQPFARGTLITTSHFSKAALTEAVPRRTAAAEKGRRDASVKVGEEA